MEWYEKTVDGQRFRLRVFTDGTGTLTVRSVGTFGTVSIARLELPPAETSLFRRAYWPKTEEERAGAMAEAEAMFSLTGGAGNG